MNVQINELVSVNDEFTITCLANGFMLNASGKNKNDDYVVFKCFFFTAYEVSQAIDTLNMLPKL